MTKRPIWYSLPMVFSLAVSLILSGPLAVFAQDSDPDDNPANQIFIPFISNGTQSDAAAEDEAADDEAPAVTNLTVSSGSMLVAAAGRPVRNLPDTLAAQRLRGYPTVDNALALRKIDPTLQLATGRRQVVIRLREPSVAEQIAGNVSASAVDAQLAQLERVVVQQTDVLQAATSLDANVKVLGRVQKALNALMLEVDSAALPALAANPAVLSVKPVVNYTLDLTDTVPYIGGTAVQNAGYDGAGVKVAVVDSGIDYLHANLGGSGDPAEFAANDPTVIETGTFPTAKVIGGYDFVGSEWSGEANTPPTKPDPDPIDDGPESGHGTHVGDIIGGQRGVAPAVSLYAVKVCSSVSTSCEGVALLQAMDFVLDPNTDGDLSDKVDIVNMSLGSPYGQAFDDDLSQAVENVSAAGVLVVASAGNSADKPYVTGSPAAALSALSVAQTQVPKAVQPVMEIVAPAAIAGQYPATLQDWSAPLSVALEGPAQYADGAGGNLTGCTPFAAGSLTGKIVLVDRGACNISLKISNIADGGALAGIVGLIAPGDPTQFSFGGGTPERISGFNITQAHATLIKRALAANETVTLRFDPNTGIPVVKHLVGSSSRGPTMLTNYIKPEIGAPGESISAVAGSGSGEEAFGGTSGAAPMVSGAAALLAQAYPDRSPAELKAVLMNTAETEILNKPLLFGGYLAAITRIGGGEVRVDRALNAAAAAWDANAPTAALNFTFYDVTKEKVVLKRVVNIRNYSNKSIEYEIGSNFRYPDDAATEAIEINTPDDIRVPAHGDKQFEVTMIIRGKKLLDWALNSGSRGANADILTAMEMDGYVTLTDEDNAANSIHLPWHILPRKAGDVTLKTKSHYVAIRNRGVATTTVEAYSLIAISPNIPEGTAGANSPQPDLRYVGYTTFGVPAGFCSDTDSFIMGFAINTWERQTHANGPAEFDLFIDINQDGESDFNVFNYDLSFAGGRSDGRNAVWIIDLVNSPTVATPLDFVDHDTNSANTVFYLCAEDLGLTLADVGKPMDLSVTAADAYFSGFRITDIVEGITVAAGGEKYIGVFDDGGVGATLLGYKTNDKLRILATGSDTNNSEQGLLLLYRGGAPAGAEAGVVLIEEE